MDTSRLLILTGLAILAVGLLWPLLGWLGIGRLPGDILIQRDNFTFYLPLVTSLILSVVLSLILSLVFWLANR